MALIIELGLCESRYARNIVLVANSFSSFDLWSSGRQYFFRLVSTPQILAAI
jgi:hypothetical protein